ncbi:unnamed protein product [Urochloa decumbens]|uniref:DUF1618 domain-containing protein n=1 Tax=Urochloa decumbens TaxID=240449 RepID=A0ABC8VER3_9POAL
MGSPPRPMPPLIRSPSPAAPQWVVLRRIPRVSRTDNDLPQDTTAFLLALEAPPGLSVVSQLVIATDRGGPDRSAAFVRAADSCGILLLSGSLADDKPSASASYFLFDAVSNTVRRLPDWPGNGGGIAGLSVAAGGGSHNHNFMVAELVPPFSATNGGSAALHCFSPEPGVWVHKPLRFPDRIRLPWHSAHVLYYDGKLWWVDLSQGLLACDPFAVKPELHFVPLPSSGRLAKGDWKQRRDAGKHRCLNVSGGKLRFVVIQAHACVPKIKLWTLADPAAGEWTLDHEARLQDIWDDQSYTNTGLSKKRPSLALVHPGKPNVVYFFLQKHLFGVDLRTKAVTESSPHEHEGDEAAASSSSVLAWELPPSVTISSAGRQHVQEEITTSTFDRIADSLYDAYTRVFADMEFDRLAKIALGYRDKKTEKEDNKFKVS